MVPEEGMEQSGNHRSGDLTLFGARQNDSMRLPEVCSWEKSAMRSPEIQTRHLFAARFSIPPGTIEHLLFCIHSISPTDQQYGDKTPIARESIQCIGKARMVPISAIEGETGWS